MTIETKRWVLPEFHQKGVYSGGWYEQYIPLFFVFESRAQSITIVRLTNLSNKSDLNIETWVFEVLFCNT